MKDMTSSTQPYTYLGFCVLLIAIGAIGGYYLANHPVTLAPRQACTMEAKLCPDGTSVGRSGPKCEFSPCPVSGSEPNPGTAESWADYTISTEPSLGLTDYTVSVPLTWKRIEHSSNFQNTETFWSSDTRPDYTLKITQEKNVNELTGMPYKNLRELTGLSYDVPTRIVGGEIASQVQPRAGSETNFKVVSLARNNSLKIDITLTTPRDGSLVKDGEILFDRILTSMAFVSSQPVQNAYKKLLFDPKTKVIATIGFPAEMTSIPDSQLLGIACTPQYENDYNGSFFADVPTKSDSRTKLTDPQLLNFTKTDPKISAISSCLTQDGRTIVHYEIHAGGGGSGNTAYFGIRNSTGTLTNVITIPADGAPYFTCRSPYMMTSSDIFYWGCGGGDGGFGQASIYSINLAQTRISRIFKCTSTADIESSDPQGTSTVTCE